MCFKLIKTIGLSLLLISCSNDHKFDEDTATVVALNYDTNCLSQIEPDFKLYKNEILSDARISSHFKCLSDAIDYIQIRVKGEKEGYYNDAEIKNFLNKFLFTNTNKSQNFFTTLLTLKSQIFGGDESGLSFLDLATLKVFLQSLEKVVLISKPFASELFFETNFENADDVGKAVRPLVRFVETWINFEDKRMSLEAVFSFLEEADFEVKSKESWMALFNLFRGARAEESFIEDKDKDKLVTAIDSYYSSSLKLARAFDLDWEYKREDFYSFSSEIESFLLLLGETLKNHPHKKWSKQDLVHFMNLVSEYEVLDHKLSVSVREHVVEVFFKKWFSSEQGQVELAEFNFQKFILAWDEIKAFVVESKEMEGYKGKTFPFVKEGSSSFALFTQQKWPSLVRKDRSLFIPDYENEVEFSFQSLLHNSWQFLAAKILLEAYTGEEERLKSSTGLTIEEVEAAYLDVFVLLKEIEFLDEDSRGGWFRIFNEGNIFVPSAQGDAFVTQSEAADYAAYMFSAVFMSRNIVDTIEPICPNFVERCSFGYIRNNPEKVFEALPGLVSYFESVEKGSYKLWKKSFEYIAKLDDNDDPYTSSHWFRGTVANQYTEVIYRKYDLDASDSLDFEEVSLAYLDFKEALKLLPQVKGTSVEDRDDVLKSFLTLFVKKGRLPKLRRGRPSGELIKHVTLCGKVNTSENPECSFESDRSKIIALLAYLTSI